MLVGTYPYLRTTTRSSQQKVSVIQKLLNNSNINIIIELLLLLLLLYLRSQEAVLEGMEWIVLAQDRGRWQTVMNVVMNLRVLFSVGNFLTSQGPVSFLGRTLLHALLH